MYRSWLLALLCLLTAAGADHPVPPAGVAIPADQRAELEAGLRALSAKIDKLKSPLLPDVLIYREAVRYALQYNEFFKADEVAKARQLLRTGEDRADQLLAGHAPWAAATGLVPRGYISKIDQSVQPYGLYVPPSWSPNAPRRWRLDTWFHGRSETLSEVNFLSERTNNPGEFTPPDTIVLFLYGRYCNANKFAGEVDLLEAIDAVKTQYRIDDDRILIRGFSMGGAAAWHLGVHYAGRWAAVAPGAGFVEMQKYQKITDAERDAMPAWYTKLWHLYNATDYAANLFNTAVVAYSGEIDAQRAAATLMAEALAAEGMTLAHIIGPNTGHKYHPASKPLINERLDAIASRGRDPYPREIRFVTYTLRYNRMKWVRVDALGKHWERARVDASIDDDRTITAKTSNVEAVTFDLGPAEPLLNPASNVDVVIDGDRITVPGPQTDRSFTAHFEKKQGHWVVAGVDHTLRKRHGLQGPIDDAFMNSFIIVRPTGTPWSPAIAKWVDAEMNRAITQWRAQFRGEPQVKDDRAITDEDIANNNLVLWGDLSSNRLLARIADKLPAKWGASQVPILIYPNPLNPERYVVLNSGFTFRESDYLTNSRQVPRLPDWAVIDITTPPDGKQPGRIVDAGFFDERWK